MTPEAEKFNGWMAMIGFVAAMGAYATTGQIIPGLFNWQNKLKKKRESLIEPRNYGQRSGTVD